MAVKQFLLVTLGIYFCGQMYPGQGESNEDKGDLGSTLTLNQNVRQKRATDGGSEAQILPSLGSTPVQTSYFWGQCLMCPPGGAGPRGPPGQQGLPGRDGRDGRDQQLTSAGVPSWPRDPGTTLNSSSPGKTYIHWGRTSCPNGSTQVYHGIVGGKPYTMKGSGTNYLCLHNSPTYDRPRAGGTSPIILGTEFESSYESIPNLSQESEVSCAVCLATGKHDVIMIPGVNSCPEDQGWKEEYHGYLATMHGNYFATEFICLDHESEGIPRTGHDNDPSLLYIVETGCSGSGGGLPCPPYVSGYEVTCAVCSLL